MQNLYYQQLVNLATAKASTPVTHHTPVCGKVCQDLKKMKALSSAMFLQNLDDVADMKALSNAMFLQNLDEEDCDDTCKKIKELKAMKEAISLQNLNDDADKKKDDDKKDDKKKDDDKKDDKKDDDCDKTCQDLKKLKAMNGAMFGLQNLESDEEFNKTMNKIK